MRLVQISAVAMSRVFDAPCICSDSQDFLNSRESCLFCHCDDFEKARSNPKGKY